MVAVLGNHDGWLDHRRVRDALERSGIRVIEDTAAKLNTSAGPLWIAGLSDRWTGRHDLAAAMSAVGDDGAPVILLTHNPDVFPRVPSRVTLTYSGLSRCLSQDIEPRRGTFQKTTLLIAHQK